MSQLSGRPGSPGSEAPEPEGFGAAPVGEPLDDGFRGTYAPDVTDLDGLEDGEESDEAEEPTRTFGDSVLAGLKELVIVVVLAMGLSFVVKSWFFQAFYIPSESMENTLVKDDRVIVSKLTPGPFDLKRGDVIVFEDPLVPVPWLDERPDSERSTLGGPLHSTLVFVGLLPEDSENHLIKRVIGLPGDRVQSDGSGKLTVNGVEITEPYLKAGVEPSDRAFDVVVPKDRVWVMGDNRSNSADSRAHDDGTGKTGSVPMDRIVGRALFVVWPFDHVTWLGTPERTFAKVPNPTPGATTPTPKGTATDDPTEGHDGTPDKTPASPRATTR